MRPTGLTTGPIRWDEQALKDAYWQTPQGRMLQAWPYLMGGGVMGIGSGLARSGLARDFFNLLRDPRVEGLFSKAVPAAAPQRIPSHIQKALEKIR